jgi:hypothetical protein
MRLIFWICNCSFKHEADPGFFFKSFYLRKMVIEAQEQQIFWA